MNYLSPLLRIVCGIALLILSGSMYFKARAQVAAGAQVHLFGATAAAEPWQLTLGFGIIALIGIVLLVLGLAGLARR
ncbi:MAG TPA: hypothetical protein VFV83_08725 [Chthoniobacteraceae bacterium]|nr:hypothetical protein [Chthoniobacteraceae bacterium]